VAAKLVERRRCEGEAAPKERKPGVRRLDNVGKLWAEMRLVGVQVASYRRRACMQHPGRAVCIVDEMREVGVEVNLSPATLS
jgi:hypothetical protein